MRKLEDPRYPYYGFTLEDAENKEDYKNVYG